MRYSATVNTTAPGRHTVFVFAESSTATDSLIARQVFTAPATSATIRPALVLPTKAQLNSNVFGHPGLLANGNIRLGYTLGASFGAAAIDMNGAVVEMTIGGVKLTLTIGADGVATPETAYPWENFSITLLNKERPVGTSGVGIGTIVINGLAEVAAGNNVRIALNSITLPGSTTPVSSNSSVNIRGTGAASMWT